MNDKEKLAYFAGLVDGEGSIMYTRNGYDKRRNKYYYRVCLRFCNNDPVLIEWVQNNFPTKWNIEHRTHRGKNTDDSYVMSVYYNAAVDMIKLLYPMLISKKAQAECALLAGYYHSLLRGKPGQVDPLEPIRERLAEIMRGLNYRGKDATNIRKQWGELLETRPSNVEGNQQPSLENDIKVSTKVQRLTVEESTNKTDTSAPQETDDIVRASQ